MSQEQQKKKEYRKLYAPSKEEQLVLILRGNCPHTEGYEFVNRYGKDILYRCKTCMHALCF